MSSSSQVIFRVGLKNGGKFSRGGHTCGKKSLDFWMIQTMFENKKKVGKVLKIGLTQFFYKF